MPNSTYLPLDLLKRVSRSFYLTLRVLPSKLREPIALAYLLARAADTIADTPSIPASERINLLHQLRDAIAGADVPSLNFPRTSPTDHSAEAALLQTTKSLINTLKHTQIVQQLYIQKVLNTLTSGMCFDLNFFPNEESKTVRALESVSELQHYTYQVAGCVGEFWTEIMLDGGVAIAAEQRAILAEQGRRFGQALQMTNILRDLPNDLRIGRCYLPQEILAPAQLQVADLFDETQTVRLRHAVRPLVNATRDDFRAGLAYLHTIPRHHLRLRLACFWPLVLGLATLAKTLNNPHWLSTQHPSKISRASVYRMLLVSLFVIWSNTALSIWFEQLNKGLCNKLTKPIYHSGSAESSSN